MREVFGLQIVLFFRWRFFHIFIFSEGEGGEYKVFFDGLFLLSYKQENMSM